MYKIELTTSTPTMELTSQNSGVVFWGTICGTLSDQTDLQTALNAKANIATTLAGYGITDAKIEGGVITLGSNTITPITDISSKADITYVNTQLATKANIATTLNGYGITDAYTKTEADTLLGGKVTSNNAITGATKCKITYDSKGLVTAGADLVAGDIPDLSSVYYPATNPSGYQTATEVSATVSAYHDSSKQDTLTAGANVQINGSTISATDTTYTAGTGISIVGNVISNTQTSAEWGNIEGTLSAQTDLQSALNSKVNIAQGTANVGKILKVNASGDLELANDEGHTVGEIVPVIGCASTYVPEGCVPCDGAEYSRSQFAALYDEYLTAQAPKLVTCTYQEYASDISTYGQCAKWGLDTTNQKFKVPTIKGGAFLQQALQDNEIGKSYNAGLPNITGDVEQAHMADHDPSSVRNWNDGKSLYMEQATHINKNSDGEATGYGMALLFDASRSSPIYGRSDTVQPNAVTVRYFVCVAGGAINQSMMDWSAWASGLAGKLNADFSNKPNNIHCIFETYVNGTSGYRIWSDGYCEQWGVSTNVADRETTNITFLKTFVDTNYTINGTTIWQGTNDDNTWMQAWKIQQDSLSATGFNFYSRSTTTKVLRWKVCGYLAEGEY